jgi:zinc/manganese transport system permease protein
MDQVLRLLGYEFAQNALAAGVVIALVCGIVSWFVVARNMSFAVHALSELGFTGAAAAVYLGVSTIVGLLVGTFVSAILIGILGVRARERDTVVGVIMAFGLGLGVLFLTLYPRYATQAFAILFGTITGVSQADVLLLVGVGFLTLVGLAVVYRPLMFATVDADVAAARGVPVSVLGVIFLLIMAAAVAEAVQIVGVLLILTLLITPGATAERLSASPGRAILISVAVALLCVVGGILLSLAFNLPVSVFVTGLSFACYIAARSVLGPIAFGRRRQNISLGNVADGPT